MENHADPQMRQILLFVAGMTPQIITETLYVLMQQRGEQVHEIRVITTLAGRDRLLKELLDPATGKFFDFCHDYGIDPAGIKFDETTIALLRTPDGRTLADIRTPEENEYAGDQICDIVRQIAKDPAVRIHASAAGGRKTMSIYLTAAMQLFGRAHDTLSHVLVTEQFEMHPDFYYVPRVHSVIKMRNGPDISTEFARIHLAPIPFIRLQGAVTWLDKGEGSYNILVRQTQEDLDLLESGHDLVFDLRRGTIVVSNRTVRLPAREFFVYTLFAYLRRQQRGENGFVTLDEIHVSDVDTVFRLITRAKGKELNAKDYQLAARFGFMPNLMGLIEDPTKDPKSLSELFTQVGSKIKRRFEKAGPLGRYLISNRGGYAASRYGLDVPPERIIFQ